VRESLKVSAGTYFNVKANEYNTVHYVEQSSGGMWNRHQLTLEMVAAGGLETNARILDVGCGPGHLVFDLDRMGFQVTGLDVAPAMIDLCRQHAQALKTEIPRFVTGDVENTGLPSGSFDAVTALGVIEYMESDSPMLREMHRVLRPGGILILNVTNTYGYSTALVPASLKVKRLPGMMSVASWIRRRVTGSKMPAGQLNFNPRRHKPAAFRRALSDHGFDVIEDRYLTFSLLPAPFSTLTSAITRSIDERLGALDRTALRGLGACYLVQARKRGR
jgi:2-polyprenyl-3-methyl-5-hydroxy-6-metoxy-1,4-benzoquinol methylase